MCSLNEESLNLTCHQSVWFCITVCLRRLPTTLVVFRGKGRSAVFVVEKWETRKVRRKTDKLLQRATYNAKKSREEEEVCNWKSGRNAKERAVAEGVMQEDYQAGMPWGFLAVAYFIGYLKVQIIRLMLKWCSQDHFGSWLPSPIVTLGFCPGYYHHVGYRINMHVNVW